jgi:ketosteroid isomerase-like protein
VSDVRDAIDAWTAAIVARDSVAADALLHPDYVLQSAGGYGTNVPRSAWLTGLEEIDTRSLEPVELEIGEFDDTAVAVGRWRWDASTPERDLTGDYRITDVLVRTADGAWRPRWRVSTKVDA